MQVQEWKTVEMKRDMDSIGDLLLHIEQSDVQRATCNYP